MGQITSANQKPSLTYLGFKKDQAVKHNLSHQQLTENALINREGQLSDDGVLCVNTGKFTGRSPKDRYIVEDIITSKRVDWGNVNIAISVKDFNSLYTKIVAYLANKDIYVTDACAGADPLHRLNLRVITEYAYQALFARNLFIAVAEDQLSYPEWTVIAAPGFFAVPTVDGTSNPNFTIINFSQRVVLIGGTGYTGEIKKAMFSVMNFLLPQAGVLPMHCAANLGSAGDTALFFGLSGTGKTTLSADLHRPLIGDDEHGWANDDVFNFEGGCYAKVVNLTKEHEPQIFDAIKPGALLENVGFFKGSATVDFKDIAITENTRVSYPINFLTNVASGSRGPAPRNIFFLTADAFGVLPPVSKLTAKQVMYYYLSGYTAKIAGTEFGIDEPQATFSACFGKAFLPLAPTVYADMLGKKLEAGNINVWLINTGWIGGAFGVGKRIKLSYTRAIINAALNGRLNTVKYETLPVFSLAYPATCPDVPQELLNPAQMWADKTLYQHQLLKLKELFDKNYEQYAKPLAQNKMAELQHA